MPSANPVCIDREQLARKLETANPNHADPRRGYALIDVLEPASFAREHIPASINVPRGEERRLEACFDKRKEIIVYCASPSCKASHECAEELLRLGFRRVVEYEGGLSDWRAGGFAIAGMD